MGSNQKNSDPKAPGNSPARTGKKVEINNAVRKELEVLTANFDGTRLVATFKNRNKQTLRNLSISYTARKGRQTVDTGRIRANRDEIGPTEEVGFKTTLDQDADVIELIAVDSN
ncbi:MAG: hypothetical protein NW220_12960 [Leptolyngbyaceae cyanobacterium bins.349]|nr:hypothetical protein [Leptolyngbyaceae cyanobacterium bins.349]